MRTSLFKHPRAGCSQPCALALALAAVLAAAPASAQPSMPSPGRLPPTATTPAPGVPQDHRPAPGLQGAGTGGQIRMAVEQDLRLDILRAQATYGPRWPPDVRLGDVVNTGQGGLGVESLQVARHAAVAGTSPSCTQQRGMNDRITVPLAANFRIQSVGVADDIQRDPQAATIAGAALAWRISGPHGFDVQPAVWAANGECASRYSITHVRVVGPEGYDPYTGRPVPPGPR